MNSGLNGTMTSTKAHPSLYFFPAQCFFYEEMEFARGAVVSTMVNVANVMWFQTCGIISELWQYTSPFIWISICQSLRKRFYTTETVSGQVVVRC